MLFRSLIDQLTKQFAEAGIEAAQAEAETLLAEVVGVSRGEIAAAAIGGQQPSAEHLAIILAFADRRAAREPLQHLTGRAYFRDLTLAVGKGVFVPRPETELIAGLGVQALKASGLSNPVGVDLGTGSGAIALSMATEVPGSVIHAVEYSEDALPWTRRNFETYNAQGANARVIQGDMRDAFPDLNGQVDVVIANPPYIPDAMIPIYPEVVLHDPKLALYGGTDGLDLVRAAIATAHRLLKPGGFFAVEHADIQGPAVVQLLTEAGWEQVTQNLDLNGRDRVVSAKRA